jgi:hypothetical protein
VTDAELLAGFRDATLPAAAFRHVDHVRVAWLYLGEGDDGARFSADLIRFATAHGAAAKYSAPITRAWLARIAERRGACGATSWPEFAAANPDLLVFTTPA